MNENLALRVLPFLLTGILLVVSCSEESSDRYNLNQAEISSTPVQSLAVDLTPEGRAAYGIIDSATQFCDEAVGEAGETPDVVLAFRTLLKEEHADHAFKTLLKDATIAGQLYALCGLYYTDHDYFLQTIQPFRTSKQEVETFMGCLVMTDTVCNIVEQDDRQTVRLNSLDQTVQEWVDSTNSTTMFYDIIGGGWPNVLKESGGFRWLKQKS